MKKKPSTRIDVQVIDFFSGCGGMSFGFATAKTKNVHYVLKAGVEIDPHANATFNRMLGVTPTELDVRKLEDPKALRSFKKRWGVDTTKPLVLIGCAPCQGFSSHRKKDRRSDNRNSLLETFANICCCLKPELVVMENVPEMLQKKHWSHFAAWRQKLQQAGYTVRARIYNLAQFGVPQERFRAVVLASRTWKHFRMPQPLLQPSEFGTVRSAIGSLPPLAIGEVHPSDPMHVTSRHRPETVRLIKMIPQDGGSRRALPRGVGPLCLQSVDGFRDVYGRLWWDKPAVAITARCRTPSCGRYTHPAQDRGLSVREAALLQGFPMEYFFEGPFDDKFKQIGNAVSPIFSAALAQHIDKEWLRDHSVISRDEDSCTDVVKPLEKSFSSSIAAIKRKLRQTSTKHAGSKTK